MKRERTFITLMLVAMSMLFVSSIHAQGRGRSNHSNGNHVQPQHHQSQSRQGNSKVVIIREYPAPHYTYNYHARPQYIAPSWAPNYYQRAVQPRYVYFQDYNVYYDFSRQGYISWMSNRWVLSTAPPMPMRKVDMNRVVYTDVDYYDDDINYYHVHYRPQYVVVRR